MLSLKFIRDNKELVKKSIKSKNTTDNIDDILLMDKNRRNFIVDVEDLKAKRNVLNKNIAKKNNVKESIEQMKSISAKIKEIDKKLSSLEEELNEKLLYVPNIINIDVPIGKDESSNKVIREWGKKPDFDFEIKGHQEICETLDLVDFKRAVKMSGSGFPLYTANGAKLERALINFMLDYHIENHGYTELIPPFIVSNKSPLTTGNLPKFKEDMYYIETDDMYCIPTAEVPVTNIHSNEVVSEAELPKKYVAYSACFRREAGSYGKDTKGLLRLHQFNKVELVKFVKPEDSYNELELLLENAEKILQLLNLHYRIVLLASGDLSFSASKCYDIEVWSPYENKYLEVSSCSNFESFQSTRGNIKFRNSNNKLEFLHTLNGSGLATPRLLVSLLETYQNNNNSLTIPKVLIPYMDVDLIK